MIDGIGNGLPSMASLVQTLVQDQYMQHHLVANPFRRLNRYYLDQANRYHRVEKTMCRLLDLTRDLYSDYYVTESSHQVLQVAYS